MGRIKYIALLLFAVLIGFIVLEYAQHTTTLVYPNEYSGLEILDNGLTFTPSFSIHNITEGKVDTTEDGLVDQKFLVANPDTDRELYYGLLDVDANGTFDKVSIDYNKNTMFYRLINTDEDGNIGYQFLGVSNLNIDKRYVVVYYDYNTDGYFDFRQKMEPLNSKSLSEQEIMYEKTWYPIVNEYESSYAISVLEIPTGKNIHVLFDRELGKWRKLTDLEYDQRHGQVD